MPAGLAAVAPWAGAQKGYPERPVTIELGTNILLGLDPARIAEIPGIIASQAKAEVEGTSASPEPPPLWDGHAADRIADLLAEPA